MTLVLEAVSIRLGAAAPLFAPVSLSIAPGTVGSVMGPSGIGKSTLLDAVGGHLGRGFRQAGRIVLNGRDLEGVAPEQRRIGLMFQDAVLFPHMSLGDNLAFGLAAQVRGRTARRDRVIDALDQAGLGGLGDRDPATLSGGQRARAALMRTILSDPLALLLDEPFSRLDADLRAEMRAFTFGHIRERRIPALMVTHDQADAEGAGGPVIQLVAV